MSATGRWKMVVGGLVLVLSGAVGTMLAIPGWALYQGWATPFPEGPDPDLGLAVMERLGHVNAQPSSCAAVSPVSASGRHAFSAAA